MRKALLHSIILTGSFFAVWFALSRVDFMTTLHLAQVTKENERKISEFILESMRKKGARTACRSGAGVNQKDKATDLRGKRNCR